MTLDYSIETQAERLAAINKLLEQYPNPSSKELTHMADYILYGKQPSGLNSIQQGDVLPPPSIHQTFKRTEDKNLSLDALLEDPSFSPPHGRQVYTRTNRPVSRTLDADVPHMAELWQSIDTLSHIIAVSEGKVTDESVEKRSGRDLYLLKHWVANLRLHQYYLRDSYKPTIHFLSPDKPEPQPVNFDSHSAYSISKQELDDKLAASYAPSTAMFYPDSPTSFKWIVRHQDFNWEDPFHIKCLLLNYAAVYEENWDRLESWGRTLIYDFDRYFEMCAFPDYVRFIVTRKIDGLNFAAIREEVRVNYGLTIHPNTVGSICNKRVPREMARMAKRHRLLLETPPGRLKFCASCGRRLPPSNLFFFVNSLKPDGLSTTCKECVYKKRSVENS